MKLSKKHWTFHRILFLLDIRNLTDWWKYIFCVNFPGSEFLPVAFRSSCCRPLLIALLGSPTIYRSHIYRIFSPRFNKEWNFRAEASGIASCTVSHLTTIYHAGLLGRFARDSLASVPTPLTRTGTILR